MAVITMNVPCVISLRSGNDAYGVPKYLAGKPSLCAVVKLVRRSQHTTVRADSGATRGHADEVVADAVLLVSKKIEPVIDSKIVVRGVSMRIVSIRDRMDVMGRLDHYEIGCSIE